MNKKAQFYILAAVILLAITFGIFSSKKTIAKPTETLEELAENYIKEATFAANLGNLSDFTIKFHDFAVTKDKDFEMVYILSYSGNITSLSRIKSKIFINRHDLLFNESVNFEKEELTTVTIADQEYEFNTSDDGINAIFISSKENERRVIIK